MLGLKFARCTITVIFNRVSCTRYRNISKSCGAVLKMSRARAETKLWHLNLSNKSNKFIFGYQMSSNFLRVSKSGANAIKKSTPSLGIPYLGV